MKTLKLEVGKTYRNRRGEEVKITTKAFAGRPPYQGDNGNWYTENGRWDYFGPEAPEDLIEEVVMPDANQKHNEMEVLVLQVGKTYINGKGKEVEIIGEGNTLKHIYRGSNLEWYTENGRFYLAREESEYDLIAEVKKAPETSHTFALVPEALTANRYTFTIPEGTKGINVSKEDNRIVVEMVPEDKGPKPGDVMVNEHGSVYVFKAVVDSNTHEHYSWLGRSGVLADRGTCQPGRPATPEEAQPLWDALKKAGKRWNPETMQVEDVPESDRILEWVEENIKDGYYNHEDVAEAIEGYLNHKEDKK